LVLFNIPITIFGQFNNKQENVSFDSFVSIVGIFDSTPCGKGRDKGDGKLEKKPAVGGQSGHSHKPTEH
jgi:hypothetical protein